MGISSTGIGSGLDVNTIVTQLMNAERGPITLLQTKQTANNAKLSAFGTLKSAVSTFQNALKGLDSTVIGARTASTSNAATLGVSATTSASAGTYAMQVTQLAMQNKVASAGDSDPDAQLGAGTLSIQVGGKAAIAIPPANYTLRTLTDAINAANAGVSAAIVNDGTNNRLVITANDTGAANTIKISATDASPPTPATPGLAKFQFDPASAPYPAGGMAQTQAAQDAQLTIDNIAIKKPSNTITDAISGVTLNLLQLGSSTVAVAVDKSAAKTAVTNFVDAYNKLNSTIKTITSYNTATNTGAVLNGESGASGIVTSLRKQMTAGVAGGAFSTLTDIGVSFQRDGTLAVDNVKLSKALDTSFAGVSALFSGTDGYATRLKVTTTNLLATTGVISSRTAGLNDAVKQNAARQDDLTVRLSQTEKRYRAQFSALDSTMTKMQSTSSFLTQQLTALAKSG